MRFRILGPVQVRNGVGWVSVPAPQQRVLLTALLVDAGRAVSARRLAEQIWGDRPPRTPVQTVHAYVRRLRRLLGDERAELLVTRGPGYELAIGQDDLDVWEFERLARAGRVDLAAGRPGSACDQLAGALALWRGPVLADVPERPMWTARVAQLDAARLATTEDHLTALVALGRAPEAVELLHRLVREHPLRELLWVLMMRAQRACGRRAEALETYRRARRVFRDELGLEPGEALQRLQREILTEEPSPPATIVRTPWVTPAQLPADVPGFTGRDGYLERLDPLLPDTDPGATAVVISAIHGTAGIGKTALAVHWAHRIRQRFSDGQLYANLRGYADGPPVRPVEALAWFLTALGVPAGQIPSTVEEASGLYRSLLAGRRVLVLLDNARDADQVRALLPGSPGCLALVTSRDRLDGLVARDGAVPVPVDVLSSDEAHELLVRLLGPERVRSEPEPAAQLVDLCGQLPLALRIAAANLVARPRTSVAGYVDRLRADRLGPLDVVGDQQAGVKAAFDLSYLGLPEDARRMFRLLGLVPGPDLTGPAAAAMVGLDPAAAATILDRLAAAHLVDEHQAGRYTLHDLIRQYARQKATTEDSADDRRAALDRLQEHYFGPCLGSVPKCPSICSSSRLRRNATTSDKRPC
jgi:DNA-binding SARP family transcriptional activator